MKKSNILDKITIIDVLIIIAVILAMGFAIYHITSEDTGVKSTSFDSSTASKILEKYLSYYQEGNIIKSKVVGINASSKEKVEVNGTVIWADDDNGGNVKVLLDSNGEKLLVGLYKDIPNADIYFDKISLETTGEKYNNTKEVKISPMNIKSFKDLIKGIDNNTEYEISTEISVNEKDYKLYQNLSNTLKENKKQSIKWGSVNENFIEITRANSSEITMADNIFQDIDGETSQITIRIYNCSDKDLKTMQNNYNVTNIANIGIVNP